VAKVVDCGIAEDFAGARMSEDEMFAIPVLGAVQVAAKSAATCGAIGTGREL
jgi:hypothetical protein